jgi:hypothetical protein
MTRPTRGICEIIGKCPALGWPGQSEAETAVTILPLCAGMLTHDQARRAARAAASTHAHAHALSLARHEPFHDVAYRGDDRGTSARLAPYRADGARRRGIRKAPDGEAALGSERGFHREFR